MWATLAVVTQIIYLYMQNKFEQDKVEKTRKDALYAQAQEAIASGDKSRITAIFDQLRK